MRRRIYFSLSGFFMLYCFAAYAQKLPIEPIRTISFSTDEGSYMNVDISPDGKTILFDMLGEIFSLPVTGGKARQLSSGIALHLNPVWSADGKRFAYVSDATGDLRFHIRDLKGSYDSVTGAADYGKELNWNAPGVIRDIQTSHISRNNRWQAQVRDTNGTKALIITDLLSGSERMLVTSLLQKPYSYHPPATRFCFSADSKFIYISYGGKIHRIDVEKGKDRVIPFSANVSSKQGAFVYNRFPISYDPIEVRYTRSASRSSDGKQLVFSALGKIYLMDLPDGKPYALIDQKMNQFQPVFSRDGKWIAFVSWSDSTGGQLWKVSANGKELKQLTTIAGHYQRPVWSPDGKYIGIICGKPALLDRDESGEGELQLIDLVNNQVVFLEQKVPLWNQLTFSGDGKQLYFQPAFDGFLAGKSISLSSVVIGEKRHSGMIVVKNNDLNIKQRSISPDGRFLVVSWCEDIYLAMLDNRMVPVDFDSLQLTRIAPGVDPNWEQGGKVLTWSYGNKFYHINADKAIAGRKPTEAIDLSLKVPVNYGHGTLVLTNARIITMKGKQVIPNGTILIRNGRIAAIGSSNTVTIPTEATIKDMKGTTIMPGMIDLHLHMRFSPDIFPQQSWMTRANLAYGVTTARDPSSSFDSFGYKEMLQAGLMLGPRLYTVGRAARMRDGFVGCNSLDDTRALAYKRLLMGGTVVKQYMLDTRLQKQWQLMACEETGLNMTNEGFYNPIGQFGMIKDGSTGIEHNPVWGDAYNDVVQLYARSGVFLTPSLQVTYGVEAAKEYFKHTYWRTADVKMKRFLLSDTTQKGPTGNGAESLETILSATPRDTIEKAWLVPARINARIYHAGGRIALGSHGNNQGIGAHNELWALQMGGLNNMEALRVATLSGAEALGLQKDLGSLEKGKIADLIILNSNPLDDIHNSRDIRYVMKDGVLYDGDTMDELWPNKKKAPAIAR